MSFEPKAVRGPIEAIPVVAGNGIRFVADVENNRVVAELDETVLFDGTLPARNNTITLNEPFTNFEYVDVYCGTRTDNIYGVRYKTEYLSGVKNAFKSGWAYNYMTNVYLKFDATDDNKVWKYVANTTIQYRHNATGTYITNNDTTNISANTALKFVGINRISGGN